MTGTEGEDEISRLINESYQLEDNNNLSAVFKNDKLYDQPKKAVYGIQPAKNIPDFWALPIVISLKKQNDEVSVTFFR